jgi:branched-chain amino acid transport system ATP-binding protein
MMKVENLVGGWSGTVIVEDVSLEIHPGECVSVIGRNGVGKSTLLELIMGRASTYKGRIVAGGQDITRDAPHVRSWKGLGYVPQGREVFPSLTVREHLAIAARPGAWTGARVLDLFPSLAERIDSLAGKLSGGEQQMLAVARCLLTNPRYILMDEPSEGLAPVVLDQLVEAMRIAIKQSEVALLLVEQRIDLAVEFGDRIVVMDRGKIVHQCLPADVGDNYDALAEMFGLVA